MGFLEHDLNENLRFIPRYKFGANVGNKLTLELVQQMFQEKADENGIPVAFRSDILTTGSLFNKQKEPVLVLYNPEHEDDYFRFMIRITHQGNYAFLDVFQVGDSKNHARDKRSRSSNAVGFVTGVWNSVVGLGNKIETEDNYYEILSDCMNAVLH